MLQPQRVAKHGGMPILFLNSLNNPEAKERPKQKGHQSLI
jgi:hypothetical protein